MLLARRVHLPCSGITQYVPVCHNYIENPVTTALDMLKCRGFSNHRPRNFSNSNFTKNTTSGNERFTGKSNTQNNHHSRVNNGRSNNTKNFYNQPMSFKKNFCKLTNNFQLLSVPGPFLNKFGGCMSYHSGPSMYLSPGQKWQPGAIPFLYVYFWYIWILLINLIT